MKRKTPKTLKTMGVRKNAKNSKPLVEKFVRFCESEFGKKVIDKEAGFLQKELSGRKRILDIGCGIGSFEERLTGLNITGLDSSKEMLLEARKRSNKTFTYGNAYNLPFPDSSFDAVFIVTTLEFLEDYKKAVEEAVRILEKKGKIVVMALNPESEYFKKHYQKPNDYFRGIKHTGLKEMRDFISEYFELESEYFLGITGEKVFDSADKKIASLYAITGIKKN